MSGMVHKTIIVIERDGRKVRTFSITFILKSPEFDWRTAVKAACAEYVRTEEGRRVYQYNCGNFNWADFIQHVPKHLCIKHGFTCMESEIAEEEVDWDEQLVEEPLESEM